MLYEQRAAMPLQNTIHLKQVSPIPILESAVVPSSHGLSEYMRLIKPE
jgi:hypothetical protein